MDGEAKAEFFARIDVFVLTSRHEGLPNAVLEAMAYSKPVIVTPGTNMKEIVEDSGGGWVAAGDVFSVAQTIIDATTAPEEMKKRGARAREYVSNNLTWDKVAEQYIDQISEFVK